MSIAESVQFALSLVVVVFIVLVLLYVLILVFPKVLAIFVKPEKTAAQTAVAAAPVAAPPVLVVGGMAAAKLQNVAEPTAAMIMAIVSDESGIPINELIFKSIKKL